MKPAVSSPDSRTVLLTGATGYLGTLIAADWLRHETGRLVLLVREGHTLDSIIEPIQQELTASGLSLSDAHRARLVPLPIPADGRLETLLPRLRAVGIDEIIHCAGCLDYFDIAQLEAVNIGLTRHLVTLAKRLEVRRFIFLSTAYSAGYLDRPVPERLHAEPASDPTEYTRTKRAAEHVVAASGLSYLIVRPSIVIGDSRNGRYSGKRYGLYQQWMGLERLLCDRYHEDFHVVAPRQPLNFIHQDAFLAGFYHAYRALPDNSIIHLTSAPDNAPTMRELWDMWLEAVQRPRRIYYYERLAEVPLKRIHPRQRAYLMFASVNLEIASHPWSFERSALERLRHQGLVFPDATLASVTLCQQRFIGSSSRLQKYLAEHRERMPVAPTVIEAINTTAAGGSLYAAG